MSNEKETWADQFTPKSLKEIVGHTTTVKKIRKWAEKWEEGEEKSKPLLLHGPPGSGKTATVEAIASEYNWETLEMNASDTRNKKNIERMLGDASKSRTITGKKRLILIDEVDGLYRQDHGGTRAINKILKETNFPVILTANDAYNQKIKSIRSKCNLTKVRKVHPSTIAKLLKRIADQKGVEVKEETLKKIAENSDGDVRGAINDFQALAEGRKKLKEGDIQITGKRNKKIDMFKAMEKILKGRNFKEAQESLMKLDESPDFTLKWIDENIPQQYEKPKDLAKAFEKLSRADIHLGRVYKRQKYGLWRYANVLMGPGVSLAKEEEYHGYTRYKFPSLIRKLGSTKSKRNTRDSIASKIGEKCHVSTKIAKKDYLPMFQQMMKNKEKRIRLTAEFNFNEKELKLLGVSQRKRTIKKAEKIKGKQINKVNEDEKKPENEDNVSEDSEDSKNSGVKGRSEKTMNEDKNQFNLAQFQ
ncbi:MAG: replication factor C large subunit [archaeon]